MNTVMRVPGPSTDVLMSHECTKPMSPVFNACSLSLLSRPIGDSNPERPPIRAAVSYTHLVLGAQVHKTRPSLVLQYRLDKAIDYLESNPNTICIVSGGKGANEPFPEEMCIRDSTKVKLTITVDQEEFDPYLDEARKNIAKEVNIPGFRKGHVPVSYTQRWVGADASTVTISTPWCCLEAALLYAAPLH